MIEKKSLGNFKVILKLLTSEMGSEVIFDPRTHDLQCRISENVTDKSSSIYHCIITLIQLEKQKYHIVIE